MSYVVYRGRVPRVYVHWEDYLKQVNMFKGNNYKGYKTMAEAEARWRNHLREGEEDDLLRHHHRRLAHRGDCGFSVLHRTVGDYLIHVIWDDELAYLTGADDLEAFM
jgi:hypothetical protein